jgi:hypothetical protein
MSEPLTAALARAASRFVGESKIGPRKGSVAAVARAMTDRGVEVSNNTLSRKLDGAYPLNSDEIGALAGVLGVEPDAIWEDALRILRENAGSADDSPTIPEDDPLTPRTAAGKAAVEAGRKALANEKKPTRRGIRKRTG